jgi:RNA polymerase sigma factor (sigma-70 family)
LVSLFQIHQQARNQLVYTASAQSDLIQQCLRGDQKAQYSLYDRYATAMYHVALRIVADRAGAEDVVQDSFLKVFGQLHTLREEITLSAWIKRIVVNTSLNHLRAKKKVQFIDLQVVHDLPVNDGPDDELWDAPSVHAAIQQLPDGGRLVFTLYAIEELPHKEIAKMLEISESTSKTQYMRAKNQLRQRLLEMKANETFGRLAGGIK